MLHAICAISQTKLRAENILVLMSDPLSSSTHKLAKLVARAGYASRREAEKLIVAGQVSVNGVICDRPAERFAIDAQIHVVGRAALQAQDTQVFAYHKPRGVITSTRDAQGRPTVFAAVNAALPNDVARVVSVGRLDVDSEGLLLLTNDGTLAGQLEKSRLPRRYRVRVQGAPISLQLEQLRQGLVIDGVIYAPMLVTCDKPPKDSTVESSKSSNCWLNITLHEGKNREIRRTMTYFGWRVNRLIRQQFGNITLGNLKQGQWRALSQAELEALIKHVQS